MRSYWGYKASVSSLTVAHPAKGRGDALQNKNKFTTLYITKHKNANNILFILQNQQNAKRVGEMFFAKKSNHDIV